MGSFGKPMMERNFGSSADDSDSDSLDDEKVVYMEFDSSSEEEAAQNEQSLTTKSSCQMTRQSNRGVKRHRKGPLIMEVFSKDEEAKYGEPKQVPQ